MRPGGPHEQNYDQGAPPRTEIGPGAPHEQKLDQGAPPRTEIGPGGPHEQKCDLGATKVRLLRLLRLLEDTKT